jgi:hypothetical protein
MIWKRDKQGQMTDGRPTLSESGRVAKTDQAEVDAFLAKVKAMPKPSPDGRPDGQIDGQRGRLIFALDATASREPTWDRACHIQGEMFSQTAALGGLDVQLVFYRGFGECKSSKWQSNPKELARVMTGVRCLGGQTQVGRVLSHAAKETKRRRVDALVFVGDAFEEDIDAVCHQAGALGMTGVPAFMFHEGGDPIAARAFKQIARLTKGAYCPFDHASGDRLKELLAAVAVYAAGGRTALLEHGARTGGEGVRLLTAQIGGNSARSGGGSGRGGG